MSSLMLTGGRSGPGVSIVLHLAEQLACGGPQSAGLPGPLPAVQCGHAGVERDVHDPPERQRSLRRAHARAHAGLAGWLAGAAARDAGGWPAWIW
jgi:hypothetical protein